MRATKADPATVAKAPRMMEKLWCEFDRGTRASISREPISCPVTRLTPNRRIQRSVTSQKSSGPVHLLPA